MDDLHELMRGVLDQSAPEEPLPADDPAEAAVAESPPETAADEAEASVPVEEVEPPFMPEMPQSPPPNRPSSAPHSSPVESSPTSRVSEAGGSFSAEVKHDIRVTHEMGADASQQIAGQIGERFDEMRLAVEQQMRDYVSEQIALLDRGAWG